MCGISGFIGKSKNPELTFKLITRLFARLEKRGEDASGFWGVESNDAASVLYHKEPVKSSEFVEKEIWKNVYEYDPSLLIVHARGASSGVGSPSVNTNNHPFVNTNKSIGLVHNGRIDDSEYIPLKQKYKTTSDCDSELLLRIFESGEYYSPQQLKESFPNIDNPHRMAGCKDIFSLINKGHMAVAVGERADKGQRLLWLFRNTHRPLWVMDLRNELGQIFFVSEPSIWDDAINDCELKGLCKYQKFAELPVEEVWHFKISNDQTLGNIQRFKVKKNSSQEWNFDGFYCSPIQKYQTFDVYTNLDEDENVLIDDDDQSDLWDNPSIENLHSSCDRLINLIDDFRFETEKLVLEENISVQDFENTIKQIDAISDSIQKLKIKL